MSSPSKRSQHRISVIRPLHPSLLILGSQMAAAARAGSLIPKTLVLNADYLPISVTSAVRSLTLLREQRAHVVEMASDLIKSEREVWACPSVIALSRYVHISSDSALDRLRRNSVTRHQIMRRDGGACQYCNAPATTVDHIIPRSKGGGSTWENLVAACTPCNAKKGSKDLQETNMHLRRPVPPRPSERHQLTSPLPLTLAVSRNSVWRKYLRRG